MHKKQKTAKNPINKQDNKRFQFALTAALNHEQIKKDPQRIHSSNREKQVILLMIQNREGWHYFIAKELPALLRGITSKHDGSFYCLKCFQTQT